MISLMPEGGAKAGPSARMEEIFAPGGLLSAANNYEFRPQQLLMAQRVAGTIARGGHLVVEAGTGGIASDGDPALTPAACGVRTGPPAPSRPVRPRSPASPRPGRSRSSREP